MKNFDACVEAHLTAIQVLESTKIVCIELRLVDGSRVLLKAEGVERFFADSFREQNIVDRISVWDSGDSSASFQSQLVDLVWGKSEKSIDPQMSITIDHETDSIVKGRKVLVEVEPVYGAWVIFLANRISIEDLAI